MQKLTLLIGPSYSGKSYYLKCKYIRSINEVILSSDDLRETMLGDASDQSQNGRIFDTMRHMTKYFLKQGCNVVIDATNLTKRDRDQFTKIAANLDVGIFVRAIVFSFNKDLLLSRMSTRERKVPVDVIERQIAKYEAPGVNEFDFIEFIKN